MPNTGTSELQYSLRVEVLDADRHMHENEGENPLKKASELIAFFDAEQKDETNKIKTNKKTDKVQSRGKNEEKKSKKKDGKTTISKLKNDEKVQKSQNRKSFPFSLTKLTKTKASDRRKSEPKTNLSKAKSCGDLGVEVNNEEKLEQKPKKLSYHEDEQKNHSEDVNKSDNLSELSAELSAALATPEPKLIELNLSRDYLMGNGDVSTGYRSLPKDNQKGMVIICSVCL